MTTVVLASSYLSGSLLTLLLPVATFIAIAIWGVFLVRRHERHRDEHVQASGRAASGRAPSGADAADRAGPAGAGPAGAGSVGAG
jgi:hypothetical protein